MSYNFAPPIGRARFALGGRCLMFSLTWRTSLGLLPSCFRTELSLTLRREWFSHNMSAES
jgi:hypothetical protein